MIKNLASPKQSIESFQSDVLSFGKHAGEKITDISSRYLFWIVNNFKDLDALTKQSIENVLEERKRALPCFKKLYDKNSLECRKCIYFQECSDNTNNDIIYGD